MRLPAYVVHTGIITAIGNDTPTCLQGLIAGKSGISGISFLQTHWQHEFPAGEVKLSNTDLAGISGINPACPRTSLLSAVAVKECWEPFRHAAEGLRVGFYSANTVGGMDLTERFYASFSRDHAGGNIDQILNHECGAVTELVSGHFHLDYFVTTISTACSSSANSIMMAAQMIESGLIDIAIAGGADALSRFTLNGFNTLMILDRQPCQPFDQNRRGLNLGEGAAYLLMMNEKAMKQCNASPVCTVSGYANANDAYHQTASSPEGTGNRMAMEQSLKKAGLNPSDIDYINLHGTGTGNNDSSEGTAVSMVFGNRVPKASSTKAYTGHTLGAAGGVEAVFSVLSIREQMIFPNMRLETPMQDLDWKPVTELMPDAGVKHVLSNSFGFGGNCSSLVFSKS